MHAELQREPDDEQGTFGRLEIVDGSRYFACDTMELHWEDADGDGISDQNESCINAGVYLCKWHQSPKYGWCYEVTGVPGRSRILIHPGNVGGDDDIDFKGDKAYRSDLRGCIALGLSRGVLYGQKAVLQSRTAIAQFHEFTNGEDFYLTIRDPGVTPGRAMTA